jgi:photosystem II stability/assembly factor-like uncharacterized protein
MLLLDAALAGRDVVAVGERGTILRSTDSGLNWERAELPAGTSATLTGVAFAPDSRRGWAVGHDALILGTDDGGHTWSKQWQGDNLESSFLDVCAIDERHVIAVGAYGLCLTTEDGGHTWAPRKLVDSDYHFNRITRGPTGTLYLAGEHGTLLRSTDQGLTWVHLDTPYDGSFYGILPLGPTTLLAHGLRGRVYRTADDGTTWQPAALPQPALIATTVKTKTGTVFLAGQARAWYASHDGGKQFTPWSVDCTTAIAELLEAPDGAILAFGEAGVTRFTPNQLADQSGKEATEPRSP